MAKTLDNLWSQEELDLMMRMRASYKRWNVIAEELGRSEAACRAQHFKVQNRLLGRRDRQRCTQAEKVPDHVEAQRQARLDALSRVPPLVAWHGDPPPGYSALDRKLAAQAQRG